MSIKLSRKLSFHRKQLHNDCWLYSACSLISNFVSRYDISLFDNNHCDIKITNFNDFVKNHNLQDILHKYSIRKSCHSEIYYYFLFFFLYFIGMKTTKIEKFNKGNDVLIFVNTLINNLKYHLLFYKQKFIKYLLSKIIDIPYSPDSFHSPPIVEALDSPDTPKSEEVPDSDDELIGGNGPYLTTSRFAKILLPSFFYPRDSPKYSFKLSTPEETVEIIVHKIYLLIQRIFLFENVDINYFSFTSKQFNNIDLVKEKFENILKTSYILSNYTYYSDPNEKQLFSYTYPCYEKDKTDREDSFIIISEDHVFTMQEFIPSKSDVNNWKIIVKDSNSLCRGAISKDQCQDFEFDKFVYLNSTHNKCKISLPFTFETSDSSLKRSITEINPSFFTTPHSPRNKDILYYIQEVIQPIIIYIYNKNERNSYIQLHCNDNKIQMRVVSHKYKIPVYTETDVGRGKKKSKNTKKNKVNIYDKKIKKKRFISTNSRIW
jgi:hypothetical protein